MDHIFEINNLLKPILSTALHDIYNEINNLFFLSESSFLSCHCLTSVEQQTFRRDFFDIINQIKGKQFIFNNIGSDKLLNIKEFQKNIYNLIPINYDEEYEIHLGLLCVLFLISHKNSWVINDYILSLNIKPNLLNYFQKDDIISNDIWFLKYFFTYLKRYNYTYELNNLNLKIVIK